MFYIHSFFHGLFYLLMTYFTVQQSICKPLLQHIYINGWMTVCFIFSQSERSSSRCQGPGLDAVRMMQEVTECSLAVSHVVCLERHQTRTTLRLLPLRPPQLTQHAASQNDAVSLSVAKVFAAGLQLPVAKRMNEDSKIKDSTTLTKNLWAQIDLIKRSFLFKCKCLRDCCITCVSQPNGRFWTSMCYCRIFRSSHQ